VSLPNEQPLRVGTRKLIYWGATAFVLGVLVASTAEFAPVKVFILLACAIGGFGLINMSGQISADSEGLEIRRLWSHKRICWRDVASLTYGGGNWVFSLRAGGRLVLPESWFWSGPQKPELLELIDSKMGEYSIPVRRSSRAWLQSNDKS
jgi:hypothetical protein